MATFTEDRILDFLDGRLSGADEEELLHTLAVSPERRAVLRGHLRVRELTSNLASAERLTVPKHVTSLLFRNLEQMGLKATATTEEILTRAPQLAKLAVSAGAGAGTETVLSSASRMASPVAASGGWSMSFASIVGASLLSFALGAGAYHVFANGLGMHPFGQTTQLAARTSEQQATTSIMRAGTNSSASTNSTNSSSDNLNAGARNNASLTIPSEAPLSHVASLLPVAAKNSEQHSQPPFIAGDPIGYTAPREGAIYPTEVDRPTQLASQRILARAIESPVESPKGTISLRYGMGVLPANTITSVSSLEEAKFRWTLLEYAVCEASLGQFQTYVHQAIAPLRTSTNAANQIKIGTISTNNFVMGLESGITLDPIHLPMEAMLGIMTDGTATTYYRAGLYAHYEPIEAMSIIFGFEGVWFNNNIDESINNVRTIYSNFLTPDASVKGKTGSETVGFFGPSIEFGWHF